MRAAFISILLLTTAAVLVTPQPPVTSSMSIQKPRRIIVYGKNLLLKLNSKFLLLCLFGAPNFRLHII
jgi:hypothetical protein